MAEDDAKRRPDRCPPYTPPPTQSCRSFTAFAIEFSRKYAASNFEEPAGNVARVRPAPTGKSDRLPRMEGCTVTHSLHQYSPASINLPPDDSVKQLPLRPLHRSRNRFDCPHQLHQRQCQLQQRYRPIFRGHGSTYTCTCTSRTISSLRRDRRDRRSSVC